MFQSTKCRKPNRRGAIVVLVAAMLVGLLAFTAVSVDVGYILMAKTQLQAAADSAALAACSTMGSDVTVPRAAATQYASLNSVGSNAVQLSSSDIEFGEWNNITRTFTAAASGFGNATRVTASVNSQRGGALSLFFGKALGLSSIDLTASAVAVAKPRDIVFVVDLSGSMNDDTEPSSTTTINTTYPGVGTQLVTNVYTDFGWGTYPGVTQAVGEPLGVSSIADLSSSWGSPLSSSKQPLRIWYNGTSYNYTVPSQYQITGSDSSSQRDKKAYSWVMDVQFKGVTGFAPLPGIMKAVKPTPNSTVSDNYNYWKSYIDNDPSNLGYLTYLQWIMDPGRDAKPSSNSTMYSPLSRASADCVYHSEVTDAGTFSFPPREMPTHAVRRAMHSALQVVKIRNQAVSQTAMRDWVSIVAFDTIANTVVSVPLGGNYDSAITTATQIQACSDGSSSTATETGLISAYNQLTTYGRASAIKIVVLMTDGAPNLYSSSSSTISNYRTANPNSNFYGGWSDYAKDAALMQVSIMQKQKWQVYPILVGLSGDAAFMNRMYSIAQGKTTTTITSPYLATSNPSVYESLLRSIFNQIIANNKASLVK